MTKKYLFIIFVFLPKILWSQTYKTLELPTVIRLAADSSVLIRKALSEYRIACREYENYRAYQKPSLTLNMTPGQYNQNIIRRYISEEDRDVYRAQQTLYSYGQLSIKQNVGFTGGTLFINSDLGYYQTFGENSYKQITTVPVSVGYSQQLIGYNAFKWDKKIETEKMRVARQKLSYAMEANAMNVSMLYCESMQAQMQIELAQEYKSICDTLYHQGCYQGEIGRLSKNDLLILKLEQTKASNRLSDAKIQFQNSIQNLYDYIGCTISDSIVFVIPTVPSNIKISLQDAIQLALQNSPLQGEREMAVLIAHQEVDKAKKQRYMEASLDVTVGFNQVANYFRETYKRPMRQEMLSVGLIIPLVDWGIKKRHLANAKEALENAELDETECRLRITREVSNLLQTFNQNLKDLYMMEEAIDIANQLAQESLRKFTLGRESINDLLENNQRVNMARLDYIVKLKECWINYYSIRLYTLCD